MPECLLKFNAVPYIKGRYYVLQGLNVFISVQRTRKKHSGYILAFKLTDDFVEMFNKFVFWFRPVMKVIKDVFGNSVPDLNIIEDINKFENSIPDNSVLIIDTSTISRPEMRRIFKIAGEKNIQLIIITLAKKPDKYFNDDFVMFTILSDSDVPFLNNIVVFKNGTKRVIM